FHSWYRGTFMATVLRKFGGTKKLAAADMLANVPPLRNPETKAALELAASLNKLDDSAGERLLLKVVNEFCSGGLDDKSPEIKAEGNASINRPIPPLNTLFFRPIGAQAKTNRGCRATLVRDGRAWCRPIRSALSYGILTSCFSMPKSEINRAKQFTWHTGLELWSKRIETVNVSVRFARHSSC